MNESFMRKIYEAGPELEDDILQHVTTVVIPIPGGKK